VCVRLAVGLLITPDELYSMSVMTTGGQ
jgi:hypothetical protein